jgi:hypothetical protein
VDGLSAGKGYVDMSTVDEATSSEIAAAVAAKGGRFLEVRTADCEEQHLHTCSTPFVSQSVCTALSALYRCVQPLC